MNKIVKKSIFAITIAILITSCVATHSGSMAGSAHLSSANFSYVNKNIKGQATATYIIGIGGIERETLVDDAKQDMLTAYPLKSNQALANLTVNFKISWLIFYVTHQCIITADIVEFNSANGTVNSDTKIKNESGVLDVIFLKDGSIIKGHIIDKVPDLQLTILSPLGSKTVIKYTEIEKIMKSND